jgi:hypothetical protein
MVFSYYDKLSRRMKAVYRQSDEYGAIEVEECSSLHPVVERLRRVLSEERMRDVQRCGGELCRMVCQRLNVEPVAVRIYSARPSDTRGELHGLYERQEGRRAVIKIWMRTAKQNKVVAFRTFVRTLLHELCHHLDFELLELEDSLHTEGFFQRESSLYYQIVSTESRSRKSSASEMPRGTARKEPAEPEQRPAGTDPDPASTNEPSQLELPFS